MASGSALYCKRFPETKLSLARRRNDVEKVLPKNEHKLERVLMGLGLLALVFFGPKTTWGSVGILPLVTGLVGSCSAYTPFGVSTCGHSR